MKKIFTIIGSAMLVVGFMACMAACDKKESKNTNTDEDEEVIDSVALDLEPDDSTRLESSEISLPTFIGIEETFTVAQDEVVSRHLKSYGLKQLALVADSSSKNDVVYAAWGRGVELRKNDEGKMAEGPMTLHFKVTGSEEEAIGVLVDKSGKYASQLFFADKRLVPVYVRELVSMGFELQQEKCSEHLRYYEPVDGKGEFDQHFCIYISDEGCAVIVKYVDDDDSDNDD